ncbi:MAG: hypothetical protein CBC65_002035 [Rhodothermaceae bacterium TMED105]|jgi:hypothetical protein|nr:MAG: hypothetical protein CBC65_002035 [Rhodothermaceae bacterium TMED105]|tara:strand:+ start:7598 stop:8146 length:549 start_codon:yes stop_codon:yes gene_type:complete
MFRGTMVVHNSDPGDRPEWRGEDEIFQARKKARRSKKRSSTGLPMTNTSYVTVWQVLLYVLFCMNGIRPALTQHAFDELASLTGSSRSLTEDDVVMIESLFNSLHHELSHVFLPFVTMPSFTARASQLLDIPFIVTTVTRIMTRSPPVGSSAKEIKEMLEPMHSLLKKIGTSPRRQTIRRRR